MDSTFGKLLKECRKDAELSQEDLGKKIHHKDGSMISRFERGHTSPNPHTLQDIINTLALYEIPREKLDNLWGLAGYPLPQELNSQIVDPMVVFVQQEFEASSSDERQVLSDDLRSIIELDQAYFLVKKLGEEKKWSHAIDELESLRKKQEMRFQHWYLRSDKDLGWYMFNQGRLSEARNYYEQALWSAIQLEDMNQKGEILIALGDTNRSLGGKEWERAKRNYAEAKKVFKNIGNLELVADCLRKEACIHLFKGRPDLAKLPLDESSQISENISYNRGIIKAWQHIAWIHLIYGEWDQAIHLCKNALDEIHIDDEWERAKALRYLGDAYRLARKTEKAENAYVEALELNRQIFKDGSETNILYGLVQLGLGKLYLKQPGKETEALECFNEGLRTYSGLKEDFRSADFLSELGHLAMKIGRLEEAELRLSLASERYIEMGNVFYYANTLALLCELYYEKGEDDGYDRVYRTAELAKENDDGLINYHLARIEHILGKTKIRQLQFEAASRSFCQSSEYAFSFNEQSFIETSEKTLTEIKRLQKDRPEEAEMLCGSFIAYWESKEIESSKREVVQNTLKRFRRQLKLIKALNPVS